MSKAHRQQRRRQRTHRTRVVAEINKRSDAWAYAMRDGRGPTDRPRSNASGRARAVFRLALLLAVLVFATACNVYNADMWDACPSSSGLVWDPEGEPQCGYTTHDLAASGKVGAGCTLTGFTASDAHACTWTKEWRCAGDAVITQYVDPVDMWAVATIEVGRAGDGIAPDCVATFEGPLTYGK